MKSNSKSCDTWYINNYLNNRVADKFPFYEDNDYKKDIVVMSHTISASCVDNPSETLEEYLSYHAFGMRKYF